MPTPIPTPPRTIPDSFCTFAETDTDSYTRYRASADALVCYKKDGNYTEEDVLSLCKSSVIRSLFSTACWVHELTLKIKNVWWSRDVIFGREAVQADTKPGESRILWITAAPQIHPRNVTPDMRIWSVRLEAFKEMAYELNFPEAYRTCILLCRELGCAGCPGHRNPVACLIDAGAAEGYKREYPIKNSHPLAMYLEKDLVPELCVGSLHVPDLKDFRYWKTKVGNFTLIPPKVVEGTLRPGRYFPRLCDFIVQEKELQQAVNASTKSAQRSAQTRKFKKSECAACSFNAQCQTYCARFCYHGAWTESEVKETAVLKLARNLQKLFVHPYELMRLVQLTQKDTLFKWFRYRSKLRISSFHKMPSYTRETLPEGVSWTDLQTYNKRCAFVIGCTSLARTAGNRRFKLGIDAFWQESQLFSPEGPQGKHLSFAEMTDKLLTQPETEILPLEHLVHWYYVSKQNTAQIGSGGWGNNGTAYHSRQIALENNWITWQGSTNWDTRNLTVTAGDWIRTHSYFGLPFRIYNESSSWIALKQMYEESTPEVYDKELLRDVEDMHHISRAWHYLITKFLAFKECSDQK